jgi:translation initiation factor 2B subunit (eIF-2B alpha/beta/delta family)
VISFADPKRKIEITVLESRPENEGRLTAKELLTKGFKVKLITDAMMGYAIQNTDAVIIGADSVLKNGNVINKSGSLPLAVLCKKYRKPLYVVATNSKFTSRQKFNVIKENSKAVWNYKQPKLTIDNFPFEEIDKNLISSIISE